MNGLIYLPADMNSIVQTHTLCTTQTDKTEHFTTALKSESQGTDTFPAERFAAALEAELQGHRDILNSVFRSPVTLGATLLQIRTLIPKLDSNS